MKKRDVLLITTSTLLCSAALAPNAVAETSTLNTIVIQSANNGGENAVKLTQDDLKQSNPTDLRFYNFQIRSQ